GNYFHDNGDGTGGFEMFNGGGPGDTVSNNVFAETGVYPWAIELAICATCSAVHNVVVNGSLDIGGSTNLIARDNVFQNGGVNISTASNYTVTYNLNAGVSGTSNINGTPVYVSSPASGYYHYQL